MSVRLQTLISTPDLQGTVLLSALNPLDTSIAVFLIVVAFVAGIGATTLGPGGVFLTAALVAFTPYTPGTIAGVMSVVLLVGSLVGVIAYRQSGELATPSGRKLVLALGSTSAIGALVGSQANALLSLDGYSSGLGACLLFVGVLLVYLERTGDGVVLNADPSSASGIGIISVIGGSVGIVSGLFGVGGPVLSVPLLIIVSLPVRTAVAASQSMSVLITGTATISYLYRGAISVELLFLVGLPLWIGAVCGWVISQRVESKLLQRTLAYVIGLVGIGLILQ
jgi:uncharacterized membrane protein YfcA